MLSLLQAMKSLLASNLIVIKCKNKFSRSFPSFIVSKYRIHWGRWSVRQFYLIFLIWDRCFSLMEVYHKLHVQKWLPIFEFPDVLLRIDTGWPSVYAAMQLYKTRGASVAALLIMCFIFLAWNSTDVVLECKLHIYFPALLQTFMIFCD